MQLTACSLLYCCLLFAAMLFAAGTPSAPLYHPIGVLPQTCGPPVASQPGAICCAILPYAVHAARVKPNAAHRQPNAPPRMSHISPYATLWPTKQHHMQRFLQYAAYAAPLQPNAAHRQPNPPPRRQISAPWQPCGQPASSHADTEQHPKCSNASMQLWKEDYGGRRQGR